MLLEATCVTAGYAGRRVLREIGFKLEAGAFVGLIGPNGCGKSTLLRVLSGVLDVSEGSVQLDSRPLSAWSRTEIARRVAFVPQQEATNFDFTVREIVLMGRYPQRRRFYGENAQDFAACADALAATDSLHLADRKITNLSGGEHRRVLLARALAQNTPLLLLDEPTAHLDITHQVEILMLLDKLVQERGLGVLAALHDLNQAAEYCDRLVLLDNGQVRSDGAPESVLTADNVRETYHAAADIGRNPVTGKQMIFALTPTRIQSMDTNKS